MKWSKVTDEYEISSSGLMRRPRKKGPGYFYLKPSLSLMYTFHINGKPTCQSANTLMKRRFEEFNPLTKKNILHVRDEVEELNEENDYSNCPVKHKEALGPEEPLDPPRKCHKCGKETYNYWCDDCRPEPVKEAWDHPDDWYSIGGR